MVARHISRRCCSLAVNSRRGTGLVTEMSGGPKLLAHYPSLLFTHALPVCLAMGSVIREKLQIFKAVVIPDSIDVVYTLLHRKWPTELCFHNKTVLRDQPSRDLTQNVTIPLSHLLNLTILALQVTAGEDADVEDGEATYDPNEGLKDEHLRKNRVPVPGTAGALDGV